MLIDHQHHRGKSASCIFSTSHQFLLTDKYLQSAPGLSLLWFYWMFHYRQLCEDMMCMKI